MQPGKKTVCIHAFRCGAKNPNCPVEKDRETRQAVPLAPVLSLVTIMAKLLDQILVVDVESTCWDGPAPPGEVSEIIQIGLCPVDVRTLQRLEKRSILVRPVRSTISPFCRELTGLSPEMFHEAIPLREALRILKKEYCAQDRLWASWGDYDRKQFERVCEEFGYGYPFGRSHLNIKTLFSVVMAETREQGFDEACARLGLPMEGRHHRGDDDAWNIAAILCRLLEATRQRIMAPSWSGPAGQ